MEKVVNLREWANKKRGSEDENDYKPKPQNCPVCNSQSFSPAQFDNYAYVFWKCNECDSIYTEECVYKWKEVFE